MKKIYFAVAAMAMLMIAGCEKQNGTIDNASGIDEFNISLKGFTGASGAKTYWDEYGLWWQDNGDDKVVINRTDKSFKICKDDGVWKAIAEQGGVDADRDGNYYVAYPYSPSSATYDGTNHYYGPITFESGVIPLAAVSNTNNLTLIPCCAVIKGASNVVFLNSAGEPGTYEGNVCTEAFINIADATLVNGTNDGNYEFNDNGDGYIIIPIEGESVTAVLSFSWGERETSQAVTLIKGHIYVLEAEN